MKLPSSLHPISVQRHVSVWTILRHFGNFMSKSRTGIARVLDPSAANQVRPLMINQLQMLELRLGQEDQEDICERRQESETTPVVS